MNTYLRRCSFVLVAGMLALGGVLALRGVSRAQRPSQVMLFVDATRQEWLDTGIELGDGESVVIQATGTAGWEPGVQSGPEGAGASPCPLMVPSAPTGALVARVGTGAPVKVGSVEEIAGPGRVSLLYNDCPGQYFDNGGSFQVVLQVMGPQVVTPAAPAVQAPGAAVAPEPRTGSGGLGKTGVWIALALGAAGAAAWFGRRYLARFAPLGQAQEFNDHARLESSAWLAPARLRLLQGAGLRRRRFLTVGGPDADVDFGLRGVWAHIHPTDDGGARIEPVSGSGRILVDGVALAAAQRLTTGSRVFMDTREFVYRSDPEAGGSQMSDHQRRRVDALAKPDPRVASLRQARPEIQHG